MGPIPANQRATVPNFRTLCSIWIWPYLLTVSRVFFPLLGGLAITMAKRATHPPRSWFTCAFGAELWVCALCPCLAFWALANEHKWGTNEYVRAGFPASAYFSLVQRMRIRSFGVFSVMTRLGQDEFNEPDNFFTFLPVCCYYIIGWCFMQCLVLPLHTQHLVMIYEFKCYRKSYHHLPPCQESYSGLHTHITPLIRAPAVRQKCHSFENWLLPQQCQYGHNWCKHIKWAPIAAANKANPSKNVIPARGHT